MLERSSLARGMMRLASDVISLADRAQHGRAAAGGWVTRAVGEEVSAS
jgi:hypothetical protein